MNEKVEFSSNQQVAADLIAQNSEGKGLAELVAVYLCATNGDLHYMGSVEGAEAISYLLRAHQDRMDKQVDKTEVALIQPQNRDN